MKSEVCISSSLAETSSSSLVCLSVCLSPFHLSHFLTGGNQKIRPRFRFRTRWSFCKLCRSLPSQRRPLLDWRTRPDGKHCSLAVTEINKSLQKEKQTLHPEDLLFEAVMFPRQRTRHFEVDSAATSPARTSVSQSNRQ